jgi:high-affinity Fe2+/Pb2+ permease
VPDVLASLRPDSFDLPLFLHVLGAMVLVGALVAALSALLLAWGGAESSFQRRFAFRTLLLAAVPAYFLMRIDAQWIYSKEKIGEGGSDDPTWVGVGFLISDAGFLVLLITCILAWRAAKKPTAGGLSRAVTILTGVMLVAYIVAMWAMTAKPGA